MKAICVQTPQVKYNTSQICHVYTINDILKHGFHKHSIQEWKVNVLRFLLCVTYSMEYFHEKFAVLKLVSVNEKG